MLNVIQIMHDIKSVRGGKQEGLVTIIISPYTHAHTRENGAAKAIAAKSFVYVQYNLK